MADRFSVDGFRTQNGDAFDGYLAYRTLGTLNARGDNAVIVATSYAAQDDEAELLVGGENGIDLDAHFVVLINMVSNGLSSSPSNTEPPFDGPRFPPFTVHDNVACQRKLVDTLGINRVRLVAGFSMGALQAFEWGSQHSDIVDAILPICGAARVSPHNWLFLDGAKAALQLDPSFADGDYQEPPEAGLRAFARVYAGWALSQAFFRDALYTTLGLDSVEGVVGFVYDYFARRDVNDLLGMLWTWQHADISQNARFGGDFAAALGATSARAIIMPGSTDLYFTVADSEIEVSHMPNAELRPIESLFGHFAGGGQVPEGKAMIDEATAELLA
jgi:homoserine O-acetyltransferase